MSSRASSRWEIRSLRPVVDWLVKQGFQFEYGDDECYHQSVNVWLNNGFFVHVRTRLRDCEGAFAETTINHRSGGCECGAWQHLRPEDLFVHVSEMRRFTAGAYLVSFESATTRVTFWNGRSCVFKQRLMIAE